MHRRSPLVPLVGILLLAPLPGCRESTGTPPPHVVIVLVDTLRADHTSLAGYARDTTPNLRAMAQAGLTLDNHYANAPWTKPSVASIITGLHPTAHGSRVGQFEALERLGNDPGGETPTVEILGPEVETLAEILKANGYATHAFISNYHLTPKFGYHQGYDAYHFDPRAWRGGREDAEAIEATIETLREAEEPTFVWTHLMSVHAYAYPPDFPAYEAPAETPIDPDAKQVWAVERFEHLETAVAHYDTAIAYVDSLIGQLFEFVRTSRPNTILIVTSDHGEEFYEHGGFEHVRTLYDELIRIPFVAWGPGVPHARLEGLSDTIDVLPTLLTHLDLPFDPTLEGNVLLRDGALATGKAEVFAEQHHRGPARRFALVGKERKLILSEHKTDGREFVEVYDRDDRHETTNRARGAVQAELAPLLERLARFRERTQARFEKTLGESRLEKLDAYDLEQLRALGYVE